MNKKVILKSLSLIIRADINSECVEQGQGVQEWDATKV